MVNKRKRVECFEATLSSPQLFMSWMADVLRFDSAPNTKDGGAGSPRLRPWRMLSECLRRWTAAWQNVGSGVTKRHARETFVT
jgi:hypothetical protein